MQKDHELRIDNKQVGSAVIKSYFIINVFKQGNIRQKNKR